MKKILPLATATWDQAEKNAILKCIDNDRYTMGPLVAQYEKEFAEYIGSKYAVMSNSGSSANLLMIAALRYHSLYKLLPNDEVIVPAVSWGTTYFPLHQYGLKVKFVDIDINTLNYNLNELEAAITSKTKAIFAVNLLGNANDYSFIKQICDTYGLILIEDNCESLGAKFMGQMAGTFGLMGSFSSFFSHHISTMEGGITVTDDEECYHLLLSLRAHGWTRNLPKDNKLCTISDDSFTESFRFILPGYNLRPLEMSGAIGIEQLKKLPHIVQNRRKNALFFSTLFQDSKKIKIQREIGESSWFGFSIILNPHFKDKIFDLRSILHEAGVEFRPIVTGNFSKSEVIKYFDVVPYSSLENAEYIDNFGLFIGNHHYDVTKELSFVFDLIENKL